MAINDRQGEMTTQECREAIQRIATSHVFHRATRSRELLFYLAERSLCGQAEELTETHIAEEVFRREGYNPAEDNLVRATVRQLRLKLKEYFETEGKDDALIAELPKGSYNISFKRRLPEQPAITSSPLLELRTNLASFRPRSALFVALVLFAVCSAAAAIVLGVRHPAAQVALKHEPTLMKMLLTDPKQPTQVVTIDSALVLLESLAGKDVGLQAYAARTYTSILDSRIGPLPENALKLLDSRQISSFSDVEIASAISQEYGDAYPIRIRHCRSMNVRDFKSGNNFVLIGSPLSNPWVWLFNQTLNFQFENQPNSWPVIRNRHPRAGEKPVYGSAEGYDETGPQYARIAVLCNRSSSGRVALIAGTSMEGTEAAGKAFLDANFTRSLMKLFRVKRVASMPDFEALLKTQGVGGASYGSQILAVRKIADQ